MDSGSVSDLVKGLISPSVFERDVCEEVREWTRLQKEKGRVAPIHLSGSPIKLIVGRQEALRLLDAVSEQEISYDTLAYVGESLILSQSVQWEPEETIELFEILCDNDCDSLPSLGEIRLMRDKLRSEMQRKDRK